MGVRSGPRHVQEYLQSYGEGGATPNPLLFVVMCFAPICILFCTRTPTHPPTNQPTRKHKNTYKTNTKHLFQYPILVCTLQAGSLGADAADDISQLLSTSLTQLPGLVAAASNLTDQRLIGEALMVSPMMMVMAPVGGNQDYCGYEKSVQLFKSAAP